jgi:hypothetical protein
MLHISPTAIRTPRPFGFTRCPFRRGCRPAVFRTYHGRLSSLSIRSMRRQRQKIARWPCSCAQPVPGSLDSRCFSSWGHREALAFSRQPQCAGSTSTWEFMQKARVRPSRNAKDVFTLQSGRSNEPRHPKMLFWQDSHVPVPWSLPQTPTFCRLCHKIRFSKAKGRRFLSFKARFSIRCQDR